MTIVITQDALRRVFPSARPDYMAAFIAKLQPLADAHGISHTRTRLKFFLAQISHESGGLTIVEENLNYTAKRMTEVWPKRFPTEAAAAPFAKNPRGLANKTYGGRMGNRPDSDDGWNYRGSGPAQITGRDGYREVGRVASLPLEMQPAIARDPQFGPEIACAFWTWKNMNAVADAGDFIACTKRWNGGTIGLADRQSRLRLIGPIVDNLPGAPPSKDPPKEAIKDATTTERRTIGGGVATTLPGAASEGTKATTEQPAKPGTGFMPSTLAWACIGIGIAVLIAAVVLYARKRQAVIDNWK